MKWSDLKEKCPACGHDTSVEFVTSRPNYKVWCHNWCGGGDFDVSGDLEDTDVLRLVGLMALKAHQRIDQAREIEIG